MADLAPPDHRPPFCRNRLQAEGRPYPKSSCAVCRTGGMLGCPHERRPGAPGPVTGAGIASVPAATRVPSTPAANWRRDGQADPHGALYDGERASLAMGALTDDEVANAVYLCDHRTSLDSIAFLTAAKERIRWLSRALVRELARKATPDPAQDPVKRLRAEAERLAALTGSIDAEEHWKERAKVFQCAADFLARPVPPPLTVVPTRGKD